MTKTTINSYAELQTYMDTILKANVPSPPPPPTEYDDTVNNAPHGAFWDTMTYEQFTTGNVPGVGGNYPILVVGDSANSNFILALQGVGDLFGPNGSIGQMPGDGPPFFTPDQIAPIAAWIDAKCPE